MTVTGANFLAGEPVKLYWDSAGAAPVVTTTAGAGGSFVAGFSAPSAIYGAHPIIAVGQADSRSATATVQVRPVLRAAPSSGTAGTRVTVTGLGYSAGERVTVRWNCSSTGCHTLFGIGSKVTDGSGSASLTVTIPRGATPGSYLLGGRGGRSFGFATAPFTVTARGRP